MFQARILEWVAISSSKGSSDPGIKPISLTYSGKTAFLRCAQRTLAYLESQAHCWTKNHCHRDGVPCETRYGSWVCPAARQKWNGRHVKHKASLVLRWSRIFLQCKRPEFSPWIGKIPWRRAWQPTAVFLPRELHRQRSLAGYSPWVHKEWDMTEWLSTRNRIVPHGKKKKRILRKKVAEGKLGMQRVGQ